MTDIIPNLSEFNAAQVERHFLLSPEKDIIPEKKIERQSMRYLFNVMAEEFSNGKTTRLERNQIAAEVVIEKIAFRYNLAKEYIKDFFPRTYKVDYQPLMLAVICDEYVAKINEIYNQDHAPHDNDNYSPSMVTFRNNNIDYDIADRACAIWEDAIEMQKGGLAPLDIEEEPPLETVFLAHINALGILQELEQKDFADMSKEDLNDILDNDLAPMREFVHDGKKIGEILKHYMGHIESQIMAVLRPPLLLSAPPPKPSFSLIPQPPEA